MSQRDYTPFVYGELPELGRAVFLPIFGNPVRTAGAKLWPLSSRRRLKFTSSIKILRFFFLTERIVRESCITFVYRCRFNIITIVHRCSFDRQSHGSDIVIGWCSRSAIFGDLVVVVCYIWRSCGAGLAHSPFQLDHTGIHNFSLEFCKRVQKAELQYNTYRHTELESRSVLQRVIEQTCIAPIRFKLKFFNCHHIAAIILFFCCNSWHSL